MNGAFNESSHTWIVKLNNICMFYRIVLLLCNNILKSIHSLISPAHLYNIVEYGKILSRTVASQWRLNHHLCIFEWTLGSLYLHYYYSDCPEITHADAGCIVLHDTNT